MNFRIMTGLSLVWAIGAGIAGYAQDMSYKTPPEEIRRILDAPATPDVKVGPGGKWMLVMEKAGFPSVEELARPELRLAGKRIDPANFGQTRHKYNTGIRVTDLASQTHFTVDGLPGNTCPRNARIRHVTWSPQGDKVAFTQTDEDGITAWVLTLADRKARQVSRRRLNATAEHGYYPQGKPILWLNNDDLLLLTVPAGIGPAPEKPKAPEGPVIQESTGKAAPARTYQDLLKNKYDEALFDYYFTSQPVKVTATGEAEIGRPAVYKNVQVSPDGNYLLVSTVHRPYSYTVPLDAFPERTAVLDREGNEVKVLADNPALDNLPSGYDVVSPYPRSFAWRSDKPATLYWVEAQDKGNPKDPAFAGRKDAYMDQVYEWEAPFAGEKKPLVRTRLRFAEIVWGDDGLALLTEYRRANRLVRTSRFAPARPDEAPELLFERSTDDRYSDLGKPVTVPNAYGDPVLYTDRKGADLLFVSEGASPEGDRPYLARFDLNTKKADILWRSQAPYYEQIVAVTDPAALKLVTSRQSVQEPVNYFLRDLRKKKEVQLTYFPNPYPQLAEVRVQKMRYKRKDGVDLTATLYLPAGYDPAWDGRLPVLMWAYPREYRSAADAAQVRGSQYKFTTINYGSPVFWVTRGYAVMDNVEMPIVGTATVEPNDNYVEQLTLDAQAAVDAIDSLGIGDRDRMAIGGHSYGAFMTANLLTHTDLFKAGIARSGAYNRTLTPFGFQTETRTYWQAPEVYNAMSPFMYADQLKGALLLIHGDADNNTGTFTVQSERFFNAIKGHGGIARFVLLPYESHGYAARENLYQVLYETDAWLEKHVKNAKK